MSSRWIKRVTDQRRVSSPSTPTGSGSNGNGGGHSDERDGREPKRPRLDDDERLVRDAQFINGVDLEPGDLGREQLDVEFGPDEILARELLAGLVARTQVLLG